MHIHRPRLRMARLLSASIRVAGMHPRVALVTLLAFGCAGAVGGCADSGAAPSVARGDLGRGAAATVGATAIGGGVTRAPFRVPDESEIRDTVILASVRRGRALVTHTRDSLPAHVGGKLVCTNCHQKEGTLKDGMSWVGVYARFPQYRARAGATQLIEDRINDCFKRSLNGKPLVPESRDMRDIVAYMAFLSTGYPVGVETEGQGFPRLDPLEPDTARGAAVFAAKCVECHGADGAGTTVAPPLWGPQSYNIGAGMARLRTAASFIKRWMPQKAPGSLSAQEAFDVAAYVNSHARPDFAEKGKDWPHGDPPPDVAYETDAARKKGKGR